MINKVKQFFINYTRKFSWIKFKKNLKKEKSKLYITNTNNSTFKSNRNKFKLFKSKLEFENTFWEIKKLNLYYYIIWFFLIFSSLYVLFFSHYFSIKNIDIIKEDDIINIGLSYNSIEDSRYKSILTEDKQQIKDNLIAHQPNIKEVYIRKILPDNIKIILSSYKGLFLFSRDWKSYIITENWVVVPTTKQKNNLISINIKNTDNLWIIDYKQVFKQDYILKIKNIVDRINEKNLFIKIKEINYYKKESELHITWEDWTTILFDLNKDSQIQIEKLNIFYKEYFKKIKLWIIYIDLRINEKIYYCATDNEFQCRLNLKNIYD